MQTEEPSLTFSLSSLAVTRQRRSGPVSSRPLEPAHPTRPNGVGLVAMNPVDPCRDDPDKGRRVERGSRPRLGSGWLDAVASAPSHPARTSRRSWQAPSRFPHVGRGTQSTAEPPS